MLRIKTICCKFGVSRNSAISVEMLAPFKALARSIRERGVKGTLTQLYVVSIFCMAQSVADLLFRLVMSNLVN